MIIKHSRFPSPEQIYALEQAARRARAEAIAHLFHGVVQGLAEVIARGSPRDAGARVRPRAIASDISSEKERPMAESFWKTAAASLPPQVQQRYARLFEAADEYEPLLDFVMTARGRAHRALAHACRGLADALRNAAGKLDIAARRLTPTP